MRKNKLFTKKVHFLNTVWDLSVKIANAIKIIYRCLKNSNDFSITLVIRYE